MCGIVGYAGDRPAWSVLLGGLKRLEYRGYDSSGIAVANGGEPYLMRAVGKLNALDDIVKGAPPEGATGIGHTRWATHGRPTELNAHPHKEGSVTVVHNGIVENYLSLRDELIKDGATFKSETDTEILAHLIEREHASNIPLEEAVRKAMLRVQGSYALGVISAREPGRIIGAKKECPLIVGIGDGENFLASDVLAVLDATKEVIFLEDDEFVTIEKESYTVKDADGKEIAKESRTINWSPAMAEKGGYRHFMKKEIFEQPEAVIDTMRGRLMEAEGDIFLGGFNTKDLDGIERIYILGCGTSWHAALVGKFLIEEFARIPVEVDLSSEFRYRDPLVGRNTLVIAISQSGETADTLAAIGKARKEGAKIISICNVLESSLTRVSDYNLMTHAGPEIGVASTKAFTTQLVAIYLLALYLGRRRNRRDQVLGIDPVRGIDQERGVELVQELLHLPHQIKEILENDDAIERLARAYTHNTDFLYLGRSINYPIALEGALKLKEISYIHAEGYPAGEMKHGPIALIDEDLPIVVLAPADESYPKMLGNMEEVKARGGRVIAVVNTGDTEAGTRADDVIEVPKASKYLTPIILTIPLQLLAYHIAAEKGTDVDQPRNLAKSVTVE